MARFLSRFLPLFFAVSAFAQTQAAEPPVEKANMLTVVIFLILFFGGCAAYVVYLWWSNRKNPKGAEPPLP